MSAACKVEFLTKGCECLTDPMDPTNPICAYVSTDNGLVYPCDVGCCQPNCGTKKGHLPRMDVEFRPTFGGTIPPGFNVNSTDTVDGKPVIEIFKSTGTQIVYAGATGQNTNVLNITNVAPISNNTTNNNNTNTVIG